MDRVRIGLFKAIPGTYFHDRFEGNPDRYPGIRRLRWDYRFARARYEYVPARDREYRRMKTRYLKLVHRINSRPLRDEAQVFEGLM